MSSFNLFRVIMVFVTMMLLSFGSFAVGEKQSPVVGVVAAEVATTESFAAKQGFTLWATFIAEKLPRKDWPKYWQDACKLSRVPCTDAAWRNIQVGTEVTVPRAPEKILAEQLLLSKATVAGIKVQEPQSAPLLSVQKKVDAEASLAMQQFPEIVALFALCTLVLLGVLASRFFARRRADAEKSAPADDEFPLFVDLAPLPPQPLSVSASDVDVSTRAGSIALTCASTNGLFKTALDVSGKRYIIRKEVQGNSDTLQIGDIFYADVANNGRVTFLHPTHSTSTIATDTPATESGKDSAHAHSHSSFVLH